MTSDRYNRFIALSAEQVEGRDFTIAAVARPQSGVVVIAIHGGKIECGTGELARAIAGTEYSYYVFSGEKQTGNRVLHITSHNFDEPQCRSIVEGANTVVSLHGCQGENSIQVGGLDQQLKAMIIQTLCEAKLPAIEGTGRFAGAGPKNICNRGATGQGVQLEITLDLRDVKAQPRIVGAVRKAIEMNTLRLSGKPSAAVGRR